MLTMFMSMRKGDGDDDETKTAGRRVTVMLTMLMAMRNGDGDVDYVYVNAQG